MSESLRLHVATHVKFYLRSRLVLGFGLLALGIWALGFVPFMFFNSSASRFEQLKQISRQLHGLSWFCAAGLGLFAVSSHLRNRTAKLIFTRPGRPEIWLLSVFLSAMVVAAAIHLVAAAVTGVLCLVWGVPYQVGFLFQTLDGLLETVLIMSLLASLGTMVHPVIAVLLVVVLQADLLQSLQFAAAVGIETSGRTWYYAALDWLFRGLSWFVPTLDPFERETHDVYDSMRASAAQWGWLGLSAVYTIVTSACGFLVASWSLRRRPLV